jgi:hypothetical protein
LRWSSPKTAKQIIPQFQLYAAATAPASTSSPATFRKSRSISRIPDSARSVEQKVAQIAVLSPTVGSSYVALPEANGTISGVHERVVQAVFGQIRRSSDGNYWNGQKWTSSSAWLSAKGTLSWKVALPELQTGIYMFQAVARDIYGNDLASAPVPFTIHSLTTQPLSDGSVRSALSAGSAQSASDSAVSLRFTAPLEAATAEDMTHYRLLIDGVEVEIHKAEYSPSSNTVLLYVAEGGLDPASQVQVFWSGLTDAQGNSVEDGTWQGVAQ